MWLDHLPVAKPYAFLFVALLATLSPTPSWAQGSAPAQSQWSVGMKVWFNEWDTWATNSASIQLAGETSRFEVVEAFGFPSEVSAVPFVSYRYKDFFGSLSAMAKTKYATPDAIRGGVETASRSEVDFNVGYLVLPGLALTAGIKQLTQTLNSDEFRWRGPVLGVSSSAPVAPGWAIYGTGGVGRMRAEFGVGNSDANGKDSFNADYRLGEFGLAYSAPWAKRFLKSLLITVGYRSQYVATKSYALTVFDSLGDPTNAYTSSQLKDTTQGLAIGITGSF